jgi:hypothetical protein
VFAKAPAQEISANRERTGDPRTPHHPRQSRVRGDGNGIGNVWNFDIGAWLTGTEPTVTLISPAVPFAIDIHCATMNATRHDGLKESITGYAPRALVATTGVRVTVLVANADLTMVVSAPTIEFATDCNAARNRAAGQHRPKLQTACDRGRNRAVAVAPVTQLSPVASAPAERVVFLGDTANRVVACSQRAKPKVSRQSCDTVGRGIHRADPQLSLVVGSPAVDRAVARQGAAKRQACDDVRDNQPDARGTN